MKTQNPWMGRARGSAGNMTSSKVYDKNVMRAKAFEVNNPKTAAQTNERNFFADAQKVCQTVSEEQLRSLFGVKPKSKSRRNALLSQLLEAFSINNGVKEFDFSKLYAIGNGAKNNAPITYFHETEPTDDATIDGQMFNLPPESTANVIAILFVVTDNSIKIFNTDIIINDGRVYSDILSEYASEYEGYMYVTCDSKGENVYNKPWGSFTLKTRAV